MQATNKTMTEVTKLRTNIWGKRMIETEGWVENTTGREQSGVYYVSKIIKRIAVIIRLSMRNKGWGDRRNRFLKNL